MLSTREGVIQQLPDVDGDPTPFCGLTAHGNEACKSPLAFCSLIKLVMLDVAVAFTGRDAKPKKLMHNGAYWLVLCGVLWLFRWRAGIRWQVRAAPLLWVPTSFAAIAVLPFYGQIHVATSTRFTNIITGHIIGVRGGLCLCLCGACALCV